jgi:HEAT repeat protein
LYYSTTLPDEIAVAAVTALESALQDSAMRGVSARALGAIGQQAHSSWRALIAAMDDPGAQNDIIYALGKIGGPATQIVPLLTAFIDHVDTGWNSPLQESVAQALGDIGPAAHKAVSSLEQLRANTGDEQVRWACLKALGKIGAAAEEASPTLIAMLRNEQYPLRLRAASALGKVGDTSAIPALREALSDDVDQVRSNAASALGDVGDVTVVDDLIMMLQAPSRVPHGVVSEALAEICRRADHEGVVLDKLSRALTNGSQNVRIGVIRTLSKIPEEEVVSLLRRAMHDGDQGVRAAAQAGLSEVRLQIAD